MTLEEALQLVKYHHTIKYDRFTDRYRCECGYTLGDGREAFLAPCPAKKRAAAKAAKAVLSKPPTTKKGKHK